MALPDGAFGACQVTAVTKDMVTVCVLDWHTAEPPGLADLAGAAPLDVDHHAQPGGPYQVNVDRDGPSPPTFTWIGTRPVPESVANRQSNSYSGWDSLALQATWQYRWIHVLPESSRDSYRTAATRGQVGVDFGAGPVTLGAGLGRMDLTKHVPASGPVRWPALKPFGHCTHLTWAGRDRGLVETIAARPITSGQDWRNAPETVDLTGTDLLDVSMSGPLLRTLRLPRTVQSLTLSAPDPALSVQAAEDGRWLRVTVLAADEATVVPQGLRATRTLTLNGGGTLSLGAIRNLTELEELRLSWRNPPGSLTGAFPPSPRLVVLHLSDGYGLRADSLPDLPALAHLTFHGSAGQSCRR